MESKTKKVKLKYILNFSNDISADSDYNWNSLHYSLKNNGYDIYNNEPIHVTKFYKEYYLIFDGHHRIKVLKDLYGEEHEIDVKVRNFFKLTVILLFLQFIVLIITFVKYIRFIYDYHSGKLVK